MQYILYVLLFIYGLPLIGIVLSAVWSGFFSSEVQLVYIVSAINQTQLSLLRDTFGSLIIPLVTAYSIKTISSGQNVPKETKQLFTVLIVLFLVSLIFYGIVVSYENHLSKYGMSIFQSFKDLTLTYTKETLTYIGLTLGISLKR